jgi:methylmalonyl-CoA/ethylmalonyl-CoA epimerase
VSAEEGSFQGRRPHHIGVVVRDIEKAIAHMEALGFGPFEFDDEHKVGTIEFEGELHGKPGEWAIKLSNAKTGDVELELIQPYWGDQALQETLDTRGEGLHHICWLTTDIKGDIERATARGAKVWTQSIMPGRIGFVYFEGSEVGNIAVELREP